MAAVDLPSREQLHATFARLESLTLGAVCKVRRIFTLRQPPGLERCAANRPDALANRPSTRPLSHHEAMAADEDKTSAPAPPPAETAAAPSDVAGARAPSDRP